MTAMKNTWRSSLPWIAIIVAMAISWATGLLVILISHGWL
jgi:hypothetical protein